jgi:hypothetical protein
MFSVDPSETDTEKDKIMRTTIVLASLLAAVTLATPSFAAPQAGAAQTAHARRHGSYPMAAPAFKQHVDAKIAKARTAMEARAQKATTEEAKQIRAQFDAAVARVNQEVNAAIADGTVTAEEAQKVRGAMHGLRHGGKHHKKA